MIVIRVPAAEHCHLTDVVVRHILVGDPSDLTESNHILSHMIESSLILSLMKNVTASTVS